MKLSRFRVTNYRNVIDSDWIDTTSITAFVGQNEAGKSNLFEALHRLNPYDDADYDPDEDWPVDDWRGRKDAEGCVVCQALFRFEEGETEAFLEYASAQSEEAEDEAGEDEADEDEAGEDEAGEDEAKETDVTTVPDGVLLFAERCYGGETIFQLADRNGDALKHEDFNLSDEKVVKWALENIPEFVLVQEYEISGAQVELDQLKARWDQAGRDNRHTLSPDDQTILIVLDLADIDIDDVVEKGGTSDGRTLRQFDTRAASAYLSQQFQKLWQQKKVRFDIAVDGATLNIFTVDDAIGFPVRLNRRSTGFRWYVSFAWKFTHASEGDFENCILLLEEPGIHLHYSGQRDLLAVLENLSKMNSILYTTHLSSMVDQANPERVRIVETDDEHHLRVMHGVVSSQSAPMAVIESALGLTADLSGMLGNRKVLIVEGGTDALILGKLSGLLGKDGKQGLSDQIYMWPAESSTKAPMYAAFAIGQRWDAGVLLDTDEAGAMAHEKIKKMDLKEYAQETGHEFRVLMMGKAAGVKKTDVAIEDIFPDQWYLDCVNRTYSVALTLSDLPEDGTTLIAKRVEVALKAKHNREPIKKDVLKEMLRDFDSWKSVDDLPEGAADSAEMLFKKINGAFGV